MKTGLGAHGPLPRGTHGPRRPMMNFDSSALMWGAGSTWAASCPPRARPAEGRARRGRRYRMMVNSTDNRCGCRAAPSCEDRAALWVLVTMRVTVAHVLLAVKHQGAGFLLTLRGEDFPTLLTERTVGMRVFTRRECSFSSRDEDVFVRDLLTRSLNGARTAPSEMLQVQ